MYGYLVSLHENGVEGEVVPLQQQTCLFGSSSVCNVKLAGCTAHQAEAQLTVCDSGRVYFTNMENGADTVKIQNGDSFRVGDRTFRFRACDGRSKAPPANISRADSTPDVSDVNSLIENLEYISSSIFDASLLLSPKAAGQSHHHHHHRASGGLSVRGGGGGTSSTPSTTSTPHRQPFASSSFMMGPLATDTPQAKLKSSFPLGSPHFMAVNNSNASPHRTSLASDSQEGPAECAACRNVQYVHRLWLERAQEQCKKESEWREWYRERYMSMKKLRRQDTANYIARTKRIRSQLRAQKLAFSKYREVQEVALTRLMSDARSLKDVHQQESDRLHAEREDADRRCLEAVQMFEDAKRRGSALEARIEMADQHQSLVAELQEQMDKNQEAFNEALQALQREKEKNQTLSLQLRSLEQQYAAVQKDYDAAGQIEEESNLLRAQIDEYRDKELDIKAEFDKLALAHNDAKAKLNEAKAKIAEQGLGLQSAAAKVQGAATANANLQAANEALAAMHQALVARHEEFVLRHNDFVTKHQDLLAKHSTQQSGHAKRLGRAQKDAATLRADLHQLRSETKKLPTLFNVEFQSLAAALTAFIADAGGYKSQLRDIQEKLSHTESQVQREKIQKDEMMQRYRDEVQERRKIFNQLQEMKGAIRVFCRVRPLSAAEEERGCSQIASYPEENHIVVMQSVDVYPNIPKDFDFDRVFLPSATQAAVFAETLPLATSVLDGFNVCIFAYGQTGSGKTFTMVGPACDPGVNYRALTELFRLQQDRAHEYRYTMEVSMLEIYNEQVRDLLSDEPTKKREVRQGPQGVFVPEAVSRPVESVEEVVQLMRLGDSNRATFATNLNERSSRSHCILSVRVVGENLITGLRYHGKLNLVDLAGSERVSRSDAQGKRLKEAQHINKSLSALGDVFAALQQRSSTSHIPYRNSKLTYLLQDSLGGDSKTAMFVQVSPCSEDASETLCSLAFASRVRTVELGQAKKHSDSVALPAAASQQAASGKRELPAIMQLRKSVEQNSHERSAHDTSLTLQQKKSAQAGPKGSSAQPKPGSVAALRSGGKTYDRK